VEFVRFGLWDQAYDAAGDVKNDPAEADNFVGADTRNFYFRVRDDNAVGAGSITINWRTLLAGGGNDDAPASQQLTLGELNTAPGVFVSNGVMLVTDDTDNAFPTDSGLLDPAADLVAVGMPDHRTRRGRIDGSVRGEYTDGGGVLCSVQKPIFRRAPDERRRVAVRVVSYTSGAAGYANARAADIAAHFVNANRRWNAIGIQIDAGDTVERAIPAAALDAADQYPGGIDSAEEQAVLADLIPITPDNTVTVVMVTLGGGNNAYTTLNRRAAIPVAGGPALNLGDRFFVFVNTRLDLENYTVSHEMHHVLFNRGDEDVERQYISFNTNPPDGYGVALPDVRIYRRFQNQYGDPDNDPTNANVVNWARHARAARFPIAGALDPAADNTTGNILVTPY
jgi:hypothetical protein